MRVTVLVGAFPVVSETFVINQVVGLLDRGQEVEIVAREPSGRSPYPEKFANYQISSCTRFWPKVPVNRLARLIKALWLLIRYGWKNPRIVRTLNFARYGRSARSLELLYMSIPFIGTSSDVLHCHFGPLGVLAVALRDALGLSTAVVTTFHGFDLSSFVRSKRQGMYEDLFRFGDRFLTVSKYFRNRLVEMGCDPNRIVVHTLGVDCESFQPRQTSTPGPLRLISVARLTEKKGIRYAIEAAGALHAAGVRLEYLIVGDGPLRSELETLVERSGLGAIISLLGTKSGKEVRTLLSSSDIFIAPSVTAKNGDEEGVPVGIMEAMASGLPVISTTHSGIPELVLDGVSGVLVPERDVIALAESVDRLRAQPHLRAAMGEAGRRIVEESFNLEKSNDELLKILLEVRGRAA